MTKYYYGISTGETGAYGVGDIVVGESWIYDESGGGYEVAGEPCYNVLIIENGELNYVDTKLTI